MTKQIDQVDVVVLGMGPGGEEVAGRLAQAELDVIGIDGRLLGGECPYWGCVPSKMMIRAANLLAEGRRIPGMAGTSLGHAGLGPRGPTDPRRGHRQLERPGGRGPLRRQGRAGSCGAGEPSTGPVGSWSVT